MKNIYLDLDGLFADLHKKLEEYLKKSIHEVTEDEWIWALRYYTQPHIKENLFLDLELLPWAKEFYSLILHLRRDDRTFCFLTSVSKKKTNPRRVAAEKELWVIKNLGDELPIIFADSWKTKHEVINNADETKTHILIDDFHMAREPWVKKGGIFIHHTGDLKETYHKLIEIL